MIEVFELDQVMPLSAKAEVWAWCLPGGGMCHASWRCTPKVGDIEWMMSAGPSSRIWAFDAHAGLKTIIKEIMKVSVIIPAPVVRYSHDKSLKAKREIDRPGGKTGHHLDVMRR